MAAASRAFYETPNRRGVVIGIVPCEEGSVLPRAGYPNPWVEVPIFTHLPHSGPRGQEPLSRNHINVLTADVIVALPGSAGTASEVALAVSYRRPIVAFLDSADEIPGLPAQVSVFDRLEEVCSFVQAELAAYAPRRSRAPETSAPDDARAS
jgi:predicted Rossmann-fold nucleotide-binding protein